MDASAPNRAARITEVLEKLLALGPALTSPSRDERDRAARDFEKLRSRAKGLGVTPWQ